MESGVMTSMAHCTVTSKPGTITQMLSKVALYQKGIANYDGDSIGKILKRK